MDEQATRRIQRVTALVTLAALVSGFFFQINKTGPLRDINPFSVDPYDAIGSFAVQGALLIGLLTYARALRLRVDATQMTKSRIEIILTRLANVSRRVSGLVVGSE